MICSQQEFGDPAILLCSELRWSQPGTLPRAARAPPAPAPVAPRCSLPEPSPSTRSQIWALLSLESGNKQEKPAHPAKIVQLVQKKKKAVLAGKNVLNRDLLGFVLPNPAMKALLHLNWQSDRK